VALDSGGFTGAEKLIEGPSAVRFVSGHDFSRAEKAAKKRGL
jgi:hypothetical protein